MLSFYHPHSPQESAFTLLGNGSDCFSILLYLWFILSPQELFDLLMDMLDERGINDEFIGHLVDYCTAYENKQYVGFLNSLKSFADK